MFVGKGRGAADVLFPPEDQGFVCGGLVMTDLSGDKGPSYRCVYFAMSSLK